MKIARFYQDSYTYPENLNTHPILIASFHPDFVYLIPKQGEIAFKNVFTFYFHRFYGISLYGTTKFRYKSRINEIDENKIKRTLLVRFYVQ